MIRLLQMIFSSWISYIGLPENHRHLIRLSASHLTGPREVPSLLALVVKNLNDHSAYYLSCLLLCG
jgi:hypothetical protein